jgi:hypothetical protein
MHLVLGIVGLVFLATLGVMLYEMPEVRVKASCSLTRTTVGGIMWLTSRE